MPQHAYLPREQNTIWDAQDVSHGLFEDQWKAGQIPMPHGSRVLELGCAEADWLTPMKRLRPDLHLTGVDQRRHDPRPGADVLIQGNLLDPDLFPPESFDVIVACSVICHVGISRYGDPVDPDGDTKALANCRRWLTPEGLLYLDVPYRPTGRSTPFRAYNEPDLQRRVIGDWTVRHRVVVESSHPDGPYLVLVLTP